VDSIDFSFPSLLLGLIYYLYDIFKIIVFWGYPHSDINKPNGQKYLKNEKDAISNFIKDLPIR